MTSKRQGAVFLLAGCAFVGIGAGVLSSGGRPMLFGAMMLWALAAALFTIGAAHLLPPAIGKIMIHILIGVIAAGIACAALLEGIVFLNSGTKIKGEPQTMVILGANLWDHQPSPVLEGRLDKALEYLADHPARNIVVTGGMGDDEPISEAECMAFYLEARGMDPSRILWEDKAANTFQNLCFTKALLEERGLSTDNLLVVTNNAHLARVKLLASRCGLNISTLAVDLPGGTTYHAYFYLREGAALVKSFLMDRG